MRCCELQRGSRLPQRRRNQEGEQAWTLEHQVEGGEGERSRRVNEEVKAVGCEGGQFNYFPTIKEALFSFSFSKRKKIYHGDSLQEGLMRKW